MSWPGPPLNWRHNTLQVINQFILMLMANLGSNVTSVPMHTIFVVFPSFPLKKFHLNVSFAISWVVLRFNIGFCNFAFLNFALFPSILIYFSFIMPPRDRDKKKKEKREKERLGKYAMKKPRKWNPASSKKGRKIGNYRAEDMDAALKGLNLHLHVS